MIRAIAPVLIASALSLPLSAQISVGGLPYSMRIGMSDAQVPTVQPPAFDAASVAVEDKARADAGSLPMYGRILPLSISPSTHGVWTDLVNGDRFWRVRITSPGALATELFFEGFRLPSGGIMHVRNEDGSEVMGGYTAANNKENGIFTTSQIMGSSCIVEYYEPIASAGSGLFTITGVGHAYRSVGEAKAQDCEVDVNCVPEGTGQTAQRDGVVRISVKEGNQTGWCSGALINNRDQDCKAYYLTAFHCGVNSSTSDFNAWKFYFKYQRPGCESGTASTGTSVTGCVKRADSNDGGGNTGSDFLLLEGEDAIPANYNPYWFGWDANNANPGSGVRCIHHPDGDEKKISTVNTIQSSSLWNGIPAQTHWRVTWAGTTNGWGVTEGGSSGSPIYNNSGHIVGTLTGGASFCNSVQPGGQVQPDYYGKLSYHWESNGGPASDDLKNFLDPNNTGIKVMNGSYGPCGTLGIADSEGAEAPVVSPNPAQDLVRITLPEGLKDASRIDVLDLSGRLVDSQRIGTDNTVLDVSGLANGTYVVRVVGSDHVSGGARLTVVH
ncbi:MAG: T9SS type A sorting domain-containing protein [Flavobacteriales bacterium]|nr:T9SS type A sorting domain-containing protein [Flavobacteriales bacterium]